MAYPLLRDHDNLSHGPTTNSPARSYASTPQLFVQDYDNLEKPKPGARQCHWQTPRLLIFFFSLGMTAVLSQHFLYRFLHHKEEHEDKKKLILVGRALAYAAQLTFGQCVTLCYRQRIWRVFQSRTLSIGAIDKLFSGSDDVTLFFNMEALGNAPMLSGMALFVWLLPLATVIASPSALSFGWQPETNQVDILVPTINFTAEADNNWRTTPIGSDGKRRRSLIWYNTTDIPGTMPGWFDYYDQPSAELRSLMSRSILNTPEYMLRNTFNEDLARQKYCGGNYNCTFATAFEGPAYDCEEITIDTNHTDSVPRPFNTSVLAPQGRNVYYGNVTTGEYLNPQAATFRNRPGGVPIGDIPDDLGTFTSEPELWIGFAVNTTQRVSINSSLSLNWTHVLKPRLLHCVHSQTIYHINWDFTGQTCQMDISTGLMKPIISSNDSTRKENWISPRNNVGRYKKTAAYHAIGQMFRVWLQGTIEFNPPLPGPGYTRAYSDIIKTSLVRPDSFPEHDIQRRLQSLYTGLVMSLLTEPRLLVSTQESVTVNRSRYRITFIYDPKRFWACYTPVIVTVLAILTFGAFTIY